MKVNPVERISSEGDLEDVSFKLTLIIDKDNNLKVIDNTQEDWREYVDGNTLTIKDIEMSIL